MNLSGLSRGDRKGLDEIRVAKRFLEVFNKKNNTDFGEPYKPEVDSHVDVESRSSSNKSISLKIQVTKSDAEPWQIVAKGEMFERNDSGLEPLFERLCEVINRKVNKYSGPAKEQTILLLEGWPAVRREELESFKLKYGKEIKQTGFLDVWFVGLSDKTIISLTDK